MVRLTDRITDRFSATAGGATAEGRSTGIWEKSSKFLYNYVNKGLQDAPQVTFLNYGYVPSEGQPIALEAHDEPNRVYIQLYHHVVSSVDLGGRDVVEVSSGRGGGARYITEYFKPKSMLGVDRCTFAVDFCTKQHARPGLRFMHGDAQALPLENDCCDALVNVEASHDYPQLERFFSEVRRVLRPGGHFMYTDFRKREHCAQWYDQIQQSGLEPVEQVDITTNVVKGLEYLTQQHVALVKQLSPFLLRPIFRQLAGVKGSYVHRSLESGKQKYIRYVLRKPA
ncbi:MAG: class I SAM-dependent methyltransferase [Planctomycetes bacterium]|nr:class I SAM-dependent methyltransferase [Planctomycetota bacterium]